MSRRDLFPPIEPYAPARCGRWRHTLYWEQSGNPQGAPVCSCMAGRAPGRRRPIAASSIRRATASSSSTSAAPAARCRSARSSTTPRRIWSATSSGCAASRHRALGGLRRLLGLDAGAAYAEAHPDAAPRSILRGIFLCRRERDRLVPLRHARSSPRPGAASPISAGGRARRPLAAYYRRLIDPDPRGPYAGGARLERLRGRLLDPAAEPRDRRAFGEDRLALGLARIEAHYFTTTSFCRRNATCSRGSTASAQSRRRSCRAATTWSARSSPPTSWRAPGRRRNTSSCPTPAIRRWSRASAPSSWRRPSAPSGSPDGAKPSR